MIFIGKLLKLMTLTDTPGLSIEGHAALLMRAFLCAEHQRQRGHPFWPPSASKNGSLLKLSERAAVFMKYSGWQYSHW